MLLNLLIIILLGEVMCSLSSSSTIQPELMGALPKCKVTYDLREIDDFVSPFRKVLSVYIDLAPMSESECRLPGEIFTHVFQTLTLSDADVFKVFMECVKNDKTIIRVPQPDKQLTLSVNILSVRSCRISRNDVLRLGDAFYVGGFIQADDNIIVDDLIGANINFTSLTTSLLIDFNSQCTLEKSLRKDYGTSVRKLKDLKNQCPMGDSNDYVLENDPKSDLSSLLPYLYLVRVQNLDLSGQLLDMTGYGPLTGIALFNLNLTQFPKFQLLPERLAYADEQYLQSVIYILQIFGGLNPFSTPSESAEWGRLFNLEYAAIRKEYYMREVQVPHNRIEKINYDDEYLQIDTLDIGFNEITDETVDSLDAVRNVYRLRLDGNPLRELSENAFINFTKLENLEINYSPLRAVHKVKWNRLLNLKILNINDAHLHSITPLIRLSNSLRVLAASGNTLEEIPLANLEGSGNIVYFRFQHNGLTKFPADLFTYSELNVVELDFNYLSTSEIKGILNIDLGKTGLRDYGTIYLHYNCIEYIPIQTAEEAKILEVILDNMFITLNGNPLHCGCKEFKAWLVGQGVSNADEIYCDLDDTRINPETMIYMSSFYEPPNCKPFMSDRPYPYQCQSDIRRNMILKLTFSVAIPVVFMTIIVGLLVQYSLYIKTFMYLWTGLRLQCRQKAEKGKIKYDAFVSYSGDSESSWVFNTLRVHLEETEPRYSLCLQDRDFTPGVDMIANIVNAMNDSRRAILILSHNTLRTDWAEFEQYNALWEEACKGKKNGFVIPILFEGITTTDLPSRLRRGLSKTPKLEIGGKRFWDMLRFAMDSPLRMNNDRMVKAS